jgi:Tol biopolymer transport system component
MGSRSRVVFGVLAIAAAVVAAGCQTPPTDQSVPPGGRVISTSPAGTFLEIEAASGDLSRVVYEQYAYASSSNGGSFHLYDEATGTTTPLPFPRRSPQTGVSISADGETIVFSSPDPSLQDGPVPMNCRDYTGTFQPLTPTYCAELYLYDPDTGTVRQLTGVDTPSTLNNSQPRVSADGSTVEFRISSLVPESGAAAGRLDLATGEIEELPWTHELVWDRGDTVVRWLSYLFRLTVTDVASGEVTVLATEDPLTYESSAGNGRYLVFTEATGRRRLVDTVEGTTRPVLGVWVDDTATEYVTVQNRVAPSGGGRVIIAPLDP